MAEEEAKELEPLDEFIIEQGVKIGKDGTVYDIEEKTLKKELEQPEEEQEEHTEIQDITEMEKNLNQIWDTAYNCYIFRVRSGDKEVGQGEAILDFKQHIRKGEYVQACRIMQDFIEKYLLARQEDMYNKLLMKATFNTIKAKVKNL